MYVFVFVQSNNKECAWALNSALTEYGTEIDTIMYGSKMLLSPMTSEYSIGINDSSKNQKSFNASLPVLVQASKTTFLYNKHT